MFPAIAVASWSVSLVWGEVLKSGSAFGPAIIHEQRGKDNAEG